MIGLKARLNYFGVFCGKALGLFYHSLHVSCKITE